LLPVFRLFAGLQALLCFAEVLRLVHIATVTRTRLANTRLLVVGLIFFGLCQSGGCAVRGGPASARATPARTREEAIPAAAVKMTPQNDPYPPVLHSSEWQAPVPVGAPVNTAGAEDSPFTTPDGNTLYFFFTPDMNVPPEKQLIDGVTGLYVATRRDGVWGMPERVLLQDPGKAALDGCEAVQGDVMWFCSARDGYTGINWFTAKLVNGKWEHWQYAGDRLKELQVGELHPAADGSELYFHSSRPGGKGGVDIWVTRRAGDEWLPPENVAAVNSADTDGWPFLTQDGSELWFLRTYQGSPAIFRSKLGPGGWLAPELIVSQFAGEPTLDAAGNLYFVHHFYRDGKGIEADLYVAMRR
jgi:hypothetical protein